MSINISASGIPGITAETDPTALKLTGGTLSGELNVPELGNLLNTNLVIDSYNDTGAGTHYYHTFTPFDGKFNLAPNGGGLTFPDGSVQTTATLTGPQGDQGPQGNDGNNGNNGNDGGSFADVNYDGTPYIRINSSWQPLSSYDQSGGGISDAPNDGSAYVRYNSSWMQFSNFDQNSGGGGSNGNDGANGSDGAQGPEGPQGPAGADGASYPEAPHDNTSYVRINSSWAQTFRDLQSNTEMAGYITPHYPYEVKITLNGTDYWMPVRQV